jgi:hypothetical protein
MGIIIHTSVRISAFHKGSPFAYWGRGAEPLATPMPVKPFWPFCHVAILLFDTAAASYSVVTYPALKSEFDTV